jgi:hypothetical protein
VLAAAEAQAVQSAQTLNIAMSELEELRRKLSVADDDLALWKVMH